MKSPVWYHHPGSVPGDYLGAIILLVISIVVILAIFGREFRNQRVW